MINAHTAEIDEFILDSSAPVVADRVLQAGADKPSDIRLAVAVRL